MLAGFYILGGCRCAPSGRMLPRGKSLAASHTTDPEAWDFYVRLANKPVYQSRTVSEEEALLLIGIYPASDRAF